MSNHDDFVDEYIEYKIFEESTKGSGGGKPPRKGGGCRCGTWALIICILIIVMSLFGSCSKGRSKSYSFGYRNNYSSSYGSSKSSSSSYDSPSYSSSSKPYSGYSTGSLSWSGSDPYDAKSYAHPEDLYYDYPDDFWEYEDAEDYWDEHHDD